MVLHRPIESTTLIGTSTCGHRKLLYNDGVSVFKTLLTFSVVLFPLHPLQAQQHVSFRTKDGGKICADVYGNGNHGVVLAHGGRFTKESWRPQAELLAAKGFKVVAFDFRGFGCSTGPGDKDMFTAPMANDVLAAVDYLKKHGAQTVYAIGGSFGGAATGDASIQSKAGKIDRIVFLGAAPNLPAEQLKSRSLFIVARDDTSGDGPRLPGIKSQYLKAPEPKQLIVLDGNAHAQFLFQTDQADRVMDEILRFLSAP
jgi:pimeloyl-ACP methyl ester carboxylesterase